MMSPAMVAARNFAGIGLALMILGLLTYGYVEAQGFRNVSRWFPQYVSIAGILFGFTVLLWEFGIVRFGARGNLEGDSKARDGEATRPAWRGFLDQMVWLVGLTVAFIVVGALVATAAWSLTFMRLRAKRSWAASIVFAAIAVTAVFVISALLNLVVPTGVLIPSGDWIPNWRIRF